MTPAENDVVTWHLSQDARRQIAESVAARRSADLSTLAELVALPSIAWPSEDPAHVRASAEKVVELATGLNVFDEINIRQADSALGGRGQPAVIARRAAKNGAPTVMLYAHHDVQPVGDLELWQSEPFVLTERDGRVYGRGSADDKAGIVSHLSAIRALVAHAGEDFDLGLVLFVEGEEEYGSPSFANFVRAYRDELASDVIIVADSGNWSTEIPALTTSLRGVVTVHVTVRTLDHAVHSGMFGGAIPDATMALTQLLARLHDENGEVAVPGLRSFETPTPAYDLARLREESGLLAGVSAVSGSGSILDRIWTKPSITVTGIDIPSVANASNTLQPAVTAVISLRVVPGQSAQEAAGALISFLTENSPFSAEVTASLEHLGEACEMDPMTPAARLARAAMSEAWDVDPINMGVGGSIPFITEFRSVFPGADILVTGIEDPDSRAHSPNESLHLGVFEKATTTEALLLAELNTHTE